MGNPGTDRCMTDNPGRQMFGHMSILICPLPVDS